MDAIIHSEAERLALSIYADALRAAHGGQAVRRRVRLDGGLLTVGSTEWDLDRFRRVFACGAGKASPAMAQALADLLGERLAGGLVVTKEGHALDVPGLTMLEAGHPIPNEASLAAGEAMLRWADSAEEGDLVLFALSGGASALLEKPAEGLDLADLQRANRAMLACGAPIEDVNAVRSVLSLTKAGGLARAFAPATVVCLVLSDVMGNDLSTVGSGPFRPPGQTSAAEVMDRYGLSETLGPIAMGLVRQPRALPAVPAVVHKIVGDNSLAVSSARGAAERLGLRVGIEPMEGDARSFADRLDLDRLGRGEAWLFGGETTVVVRGPGKGGRCQEMATALCDRLAGSEGVAFLAGSTDGTDGPTDVAAGLVDGGSSTRALERGWSASAALESSDSRAFLEAAEGLVRTGPTGSNVNDLALLLRL